MSSNAQYSSSYTYMQPVCIAKYQGHTIFFFLASLSPLSPQGQLFRMIVRRLVHVSFAKGSTMFLHLVVHSSRFATGFCRFPHTL